MGKPKSPVQKYLDSLPEMLRVIASSDVQSSLLINVMNHAAQHIEEQQAEIERLWAIESATRNLIEYQTTGAPEHLEWEEKFEALEAALRGEKE